MATAMTFNSLIGDLQRYLERGTVSDPTVFNQLPKLINDAERAISVRLKILGFLNPVTSLLQPGASIYPKPDRWRETVSMYYGSGGSQLSRAPIFPRGYDYCRSYWPDASQLGPPEFYADYDYNNWLVVPTPDQSYPWEILYYQLLPLLDSTNQTNWLSIHAPSALRYRTLIECMPFIKQDERTATWQPLYEEYMTLLNGEDLQKIVDRAAVRRTA